MSVSAQKQHKAYAANQRGDESVRDTEAHALLSCASRLESVCHEGCSPDDYIAAIQRNQELWTLFQACLCEADNALPSDLKTLLLNISLYVDKASLRAVSEHDTGLLKGLISINRNIAAGLSAKPKMDAATVASTSTPPGNPGPVMTSV